jgi:hypothetical protein
MSTAKLARPRQEIELDSYALVGSLVILEAHAGFLKDLEFEFDFGRDPRVQHVRGTLIQTLAEQSAAALREAKALRAALTTNAGARTAQRDALRDALQAQLEGLKASLQRTTTKFAAKRAKLTRELAELAAALKPELHVVPPEGGGK